MAEAYPIKLPITANFITLRNREISIKVEYPISNVDFYSKK
jgi:hypothetical protein